MSFLSLPSLTGATLGFAVGMLALLRRPGTGWQLLAALGFVVGGWCLGQWAWLRAVSPGEFILVARLQYVPISLAPVLWFALALVQTGRAHWMRPLPVLATLLVPLLTIALGFAYQDGVASLLWNGFLLPPDVPVARVAHGPWFWVQASYGYMLFLGGCAMLFAHYVQSPHYRMQVYATAVAPMAVVLLNIAFLAGYWPLPVDPTPIGLAIGLACLGWALLRHRFLDLTPLGRGIAFDSMHEGVLILDAQDRVVDINAAACRFLRCAVRDVLGQSVGTLLPDLASTAVRGAFAHGVEIVLDDSTHHLQISGTRILDAAGRDAGAVLIVRDVTQERLAQRTLIETQQRLEQVNAELERIAHTDALTGLANRRLLLARLDEEFARARRSGAPLALMMIDLDHFKRINDTWGHLTGDSVLAATGVMLRGLKRPADVAARYGGEEMSLLLTDIDATGAQAAACRVWSALRSMIHKGTAGEEFHVTSSIGLASIRASDESASELVARADAALYVAKSNGRDRVVTAVAAGFETVDCSAVAAP